MSYTRRWHALVVPALLFQFSISTLAVAAPITVPAGLSPGDQYRIAFVTRDTRDAFSPDIEAYNTFVTDQADLVAELVALSTTWKAIASTSAAAARLNTDTLPSSVNGGSLGFPIFLLNGTKLVDFNDDLWDGGVDSGLTITQFGEPTLSINVWTGTTESGTPSQFGGLGEQHPSGNGLVLPVVGVAAISPDSSGWITSSLQPPATLLPLYGLSGVLTVPAVSTVPVPGAALLSALACAGLLGASRRRRGHAGR